MTENDFYKKLVRQYLLKQGYKLFRVETGTTASGVPDIWAIKNNHGMWIEMKSIQRNVKKIVSPKWEDNQLDFGKLCITAGVSWFLYILIDDVFYKTNEPKEKYDINELILVSEPLSFWVKK